MKNFGMHHKVFLSILPFFVVLALIGSGFALFVFDNQEKSNTGSITITVENGYELGNIYLTSDTATFSDDSDKSIPSNIENQEGTDTLTTTLFFDYNSLYFIRSDNITKERDFNIYYYNSTSESDDFKYSNLKLNLDLSITSSVPKNNIPTDSTSKYTYSNSGLDYIDLSTSKAGVAKTIDGNTSYDTVSGTTTTSSDYLTYSATYVLDTSTTSGTTTTNGLTSGSNYSVNLDLAYNQDLAPSSSANKDYFSDVISKMKETITNSNTKINLKFYLTYEE